MSALRLMLAFAVLAFCSPASHAKPATTLKIDDEATATTSGRWFFATGANTDLAIRGTAGASVSIGKLGDRFFVDGQISVYRTTYGALRLQPTGIIDPDTKPGPTTGRRDRADGDSGMLLSVGPGLGFVHKFFKSARWIEMGRFGANYIYFRDDPNAATFMGLHTSFQAALGYQLSHLTIAPGITWNLAFLTRQGTEYKQEGYLPIQWWSWNVALYFWL